MAAGVIGDPYYRFNELEYSWIARDNWTFTKNFSVTDPDMLSGKQMVALEFDSIDTVATVWLNGVQLGAAPFYVPGVVSNMHLHLPFHAAEGPFGNHTQLLKPGPNANQLEVKIQSPLPVGLEEQEVYPYDVPYTQFYNTWDDNATFSDATSTYSGKTMNSRNFVRKTANDFGWDWGPAFVPQGIYGEVALVTFAVGHCHPVFTIMQNHTSDGGVVLEVAAEVYSPFPRTDDSGTVKVVVSAPDTKTPIAEASVSVESLAVGSNVVKVTFLPAAYTPHHTTPLHAPHHTPLTTHHTLHTTHHTSHTTHHTPHHTPHTHTLKVVIHLQPKDVELWWPAGYGGQTLYPVELSYTEPVTTAAPAAPPTAQVYTKRLGLRRARLVTDPTPPNKHNKTGESFYFEINGVPIYAKGANWIPADTFNDRVDSARLDWLLQSAVDANMNMVRVWGGGFYQPDEFYELCDAKGTFTVLTILALYPPYCTRTVPTILYPPHCTVPTILHCTLHTVLYPPYCTHHTALYPPYCTVPTAL
jgi:beta-mannosidase